MQARFKSPIDRAGVDMPPRSAFPEPTTKQRVIDLVRNAGIDVSNWADFKGGRAKASVNPKYCYEWAFADPNKVILLNLWRNDIKRIGHKYVLRLNMRRNSRSAKAKPVWRGRASRMDSAIRAAFVYGLRVRAVILDGKKRPWGKDARASKVTKRALDDERWAVTDYDFGTGFATLTRGATATKHKALETISTKGKSTGSGWPHQNPRSEQAAIRHVSRYLRRTGYLVESREKEFLGYDLDAVRGREELHIEVKGCIGATPRFFITSNELARARSDRRWRIVVVPDALGHPKLPTLMTRVEMERSFSPEPILWRGMRL